MAATRALTITDVYERFVKGKKTKVEDWDYKVIPENLTALKEKYNIKIDENTIIPEDKELMPEDADKFIAKILKSLEYRLGLKIRS